LQEPLRSSSILSPIPALRQRRLRSEIECAQQFTILIDPGVVAGQKFIPVEDRVGPGEQPMRLRLFREARAPGRTNPKDFGAVVKNPRLEAKRDFSPPALPVTLTTT
jgi:hypothetical protein